MAHYYETANQEIYIALTDQEKYFIYKMGQSIILDVLKKSHEDRLPDDWNDHDHNSLTVPLLCEPFSLGGSFLDLQVSQISKYNRALLKLYNQSFSDLFPLDIETQPLTKEQVHARMQRHREQKRLSQI